MEKVRAAISAVLPYAKAAVGGLAPFFTVWVDTGQVDERALGAAAAGLLLVWLTPNKKKPARKRRR